MDTISIAPTERTPEVEFDFAGGRLRLAGESYPEDAAAFFGPLHASLATWRSQKDAAPVTVDIALTYFNSSSAKALMNIFLLLEDVAGSGREVTIRWIYSSDDDAIEEAGQDFAADFEHARFELVAQE